MAWVRRKGVETSEIRAQLIEAAAQIVREEGCAAVTAGRLAEKVGLKRHIVHYYFGTIDELLVAVMRRDAERTRREIAKVEKSQDPLRALWEGRRSIAATTLEFMAAATHRKSLQAEVKRSIDEFRQALTGALARHLESRGIKLSMPPIVLIMAILSVAQSLSVETALDVSAGHAEMNAVIKNLLGSMAERGELSPRPRKLQRSRSPQVRAPNKKRG